MTGRVCRDLTLGKLTLHLPTDWPCSDTLSGSDWNVILAYVCVLLCQFTKSRESSSCLAARNLFYTNFLGFAQECMDISIKEDLDLYELI